MFLSMMFSSIVQLGIWGVFLTFSYFNRFLILKCLYYTARYVILFSWQLKQYVFSKLYNRVSITRQLSINDQLTIRDYKLHINDKLYNVSIISNDTDTEKKYNCKKTLKINAKENISKRNTILHCSFMESESEKTIDLTDTFRQFFLHFDEKREECKLEHFISYVINTQQLPKCVVDDMSLYIIFNDSGFSERYYNVRDLYSYHFYDIVNDVKN
jgi:hypothetical protein